MDTLMSWYTSSVGLPQKTLMKMMRMGQKIAKFIGDWTAKVSDHGSR